MIVDITFCSEKDCILSDCPRHQSKIKKEERYKYLSFSDLKGTQDCYLMETHCVSISQDFPLCSERISQCGFAELTLPRFGLSAQKKR